MIKHKFTSISSGGGFVHYWITFPEYGIGVLINHEKSGLPKEGESFDIGAYRVDYDYLEDSSECIGEFFSDSFNTLENFRHADIVSRAYGYCEGLGLFKEKKVNKKFLCVWNDEIFEVHDFESLYKSYKDTNLYSKEFEDMYGDSIYVMLDVMALNQKVTFDNMEVTRLK